MSFAKSPQRNVLSFRLDAARLTRDVNNWGARLQRATDKDVEAGAKAVYDECVSNSPVKRGTFKRKWVRYRIRGKRSWIVKNTDIPAKAKKLEALYHILNNAKKRYSEVLLNRGWGRSRKATAELRRIDRGF